MYSNFLLGNIGWLWKEPFLFYSFFFSRLSITVIGLFFLDFLFSSFFLRSSSCDSLYSRNSSDTLDDIFEGILSEFQPPHDLNEVGVDHASGCSALPLVATFSPHPHVFYRVGVGSSHRVHEVDLVINSQVSIADVSDGVICSPKVWYNSRSRPDELLYDGQESGSVPLWNSNQEPFVGGGIDATETHCCGTGRRPTLCFLRTNTLSSIWTSTPTPPIRTGFRRKCSAQMSWRKFRQSTKVCSAIASSRLAFRKENSSKAQ